jgi:hypothetical protein
VSDQDQLQWEARWSRPVAAAAFAAGFLLLGGTVALQSVFDDRRGFEDLPDFLLSVDESSGVVLLSAALYAISALCLIPVFYYLFRAIIHRRPEIPRWFVYLIVIGPLFFASAQVLAAVDRVDVAQTFVEQRTDAGDACPAIRGERGEQCAEDLLEDDVNPVALGLGLAGSVATAFMFVMLPLRARRAGLISPFMGILGVITGALLVLKLMPLVPEIIEAFWLGALGALFLGNWPGGRGPAWETGEPDPWPTPAQRRALAEGADVEGRARGAGGANGAASDRDAAGAGRAGGDPTGAEPGDAAPTDAGPGDAAPTPAPQRPSSRKRRRKKG